MLAVQSSNSGAKPVSCHASLFFYRVMEMPYAYQCCAFGACESHYKISSQWNKDENSSIDDFHRKDAGLLQIQGNRHLWLLNRTEGCEQPVMLKKSNTFLQSQRQPLPLSCPIICSSSIPVLSKLIFSGPPFKNLTRSSFCPNNNYNNVGSEIFPLRERPGSGASM